MEIYAIKPDPKHVRRVRRSIFFLQLGQSIHRWLAFYKWHRTRPWRTITHNWWLDELEDRK